MSRSEGISAQGHDGEHSVIEVVAGWGVWRRAYVVAKLREYLRGSICKDRLRDIVVRHIGYVQWVDDGVLDIYLFGVGTGSAPMTRADLASDLRAWAVPFP